MGTFMVDMEIGDMSGERYVPFSGIVGRKSTFTALPTSLLASLGVTPTSTATFELRFEGPAITATPVSGAITRCGPMGIHS